MIGLTAFHTAPDTASDSSIERSAVTGIDAAAIFACFHSFTASAIVEYEPLPI